MYLLGLVYILQSHLLAVHSCPALCACTFGDSGAAALRSVQCSDPRISSIPTNVPADTVKLRLEKTLISRVPRAAFYNLSDLRFLWLTYNSITAIHPSSFVNLKALRELRLDGNLLTSFSWEGLRDMPRLQTLGLHNNRLSSLPAHAALFLPNITYLDLSSNRLTILPVGLLDLWFPLTGQQRGSAQRRILGQSGMLLTQTELSRCVRPSVQPAATRVVSPLGSNVILRCDATGYPTPTLTWVKTLAYNDCCKQDTLKNSGQLPRNLESFMQQSPQVGVRWSIIILNGLSYEDAGEYRCQARNMAGLSEAPIKLRVVGVSRQFRVPKKKSQKTTPRPSSKYRKPNQTPSNASSVQDNQILQRNMPSSNNKTQTIPNLSPKGFPKDKYDKTKLS
ncbi:leucine-rich repeat, immunoglobulin-like domain and transmembrane domain-containing protein 3b isoform 2-T2 [Spinachia spinachia]